MSKRVVWMVLMGLSLAAMWSLWGSISVPELLSMPLASLWGSHARLEEGVLEVSENIEPVQEATRRLFKPLGKVHLIRRYSEPAQKTDPHTP